MVHNKRLIAVVIGALLFVSSQVHAQDACAPSAMVNVDARETQNLDGRWHYLLDPLAEIATRPNSQKSALYRDQDDSEIGPNTLKEYNWTEADTLEVPGSWNAQFAELKWYDQWIWHRRRVDVAEISDERVFLHFGAANYHTIAYVNGEKVGEHEGGFTPFCFEVTDILTPGENSFVIGVTSEQDEQTIPPKRADWGNFGGITRSVHLVRTPETFINDYWLRLSDDRSEILFDATLIGPDRGHQDVQLQIEGTGINLEFETDADGSIRDLKIPVPEGLKLWSPETPVLYNTSISYGGEVLDDRIGFRTISTEGSEILLNGEPIFLRGISMHEETIGVIPDRTMTPSSAGALLSEIKDGLNGNFVRLSHYPHQELTVKMADEMGLLVWSEIPVYWEVDFDDEVVLAGARKMLHENVMRDRNRASVIVWSVANETPPGPSRNEFLRTLIDDVRALDDTRIVSLASHTVNEEGGVVVLNDPIVEHVDLISVNYYAGWYGGKRLDQIGDVTWRNPTGKPMLFSEFGAGALLGFRSDEPRKFSEDFQADYYRATLDMAEDIPFLRGTSPWILKDFQSPRRFHPLFQDGWNRKGLIAPNGARKEAFEVLADWYREMEGEGNMFLNADPRRDLE